MIFPRIIIYPREDFFMSLNINSLVIHGGIDGDERTGAVNVPIYQTSTFKQDGIGKDRGWEYSRTGNPTRAALEKLVADLEQGEYGLAFASGLAAITTVLALFKSGDKIIVSDNIYGGTFRVLDKVFKNFGIEYESVNTSDTELVASRLTDDVKAVYIESPANPLLTITDIAEVSGIAHGKGKLVIVDNTFLTPYLQRPLTLGADIVLHSGTKYLGGHSDVVSGFAVVNDAKIADRLYFLQNAMGGVLGPQDSYLMIRGIKTLGVRMDRHVKNAQQVAEWLESNDAVAKVYYPGLKTAEGYEVNRKQADAAGAMISFELKADYDARRFFEELHLITLAESLGGVESLVCHPASMTHAAIPKEIRDAVGITDGLIRLSVGIEDVRDIISDLDQAILRARI